MHLLVFCYYGTPLAVHLFMLDGPIFNGSEFFVLFCFWLGCLLLFFKTAYTWLFPSFLPFGKRLFITSNDIAA